MVAIKTKGPILKLVVQCYSQIWCSKHAINMLFVALPRALLLVLCLWHRASAPRGGHVSNDHGDVGRV